VIGSFTNTLFCLLVVVAGISVSLQQVLNARLRAELGSPWWAGLISFLGGTLVMLTVADGKGESLPSGPSVARTSWASWTGGFFGVVFVRVAILMVPRLGATVVVALVVLGQMLGSLTFDHFVGVLGIPQHSASPIRLVGAALLILGVVLVR
jgi:bacterial/archaeal transporter family-2 protein